jgi:hypothetical protein
MLGGTLRTDEAVVSGRGGPVNFTLRLLPGIVWRHEPIIPPHGASVSMRPATSTLPNSFAVAKTR